MLKNEIRNMKIDVMNDALAKALLRSEEAREVVATFISKVAGIDKKLLINAKFVGGEIPKKKIYEKNKESDVMVLIDDEEILAILPQNVRSIEYFTMNHPQNTMYGVRADIRGRIPGVLFIFLKDGSEIEKRKHLLSMARISPLGYRYNMEFYSPHNM